ncbi:MAG: glycosyltransferase family protein [Candidatus Heimdallarchaeaceae archaeon]
MKILFLREETKISEDIEKALRKLGHKVDGTRKFDEKEIIEKAKDVDMLFFTRGMVDTSSPSNFQFTLSRLQKLLSNPKLKCKKVFWLPDNIIWLVEGWVEMAATWSDLGFLNDDTWRRRHGYDNLFPLHLGASSTKKGKYKNEYKSDVAMIGRIYGPRVSLVEGLKKMYGDRFKVYSPKDISDEKFADICASSKVVVTPRFPSDEFYWTGDIYNVLGAEGLMIHPRLYGMDLEDGKHYIGYSSWEEFIDIINHFVNPENEKERESIAKAGRKEVIKNCTLESRLKELISRL